MSYDGTKNYLSALTSEFREVIVALEQERQEYCRDLTDLKSTKAKLDRRERAIYNCDNNLARVTPAANSKTGTSNYNTATASTSSSSFGHSHLIALCNNVLRQHQRKHNKTMAGRGALIVLEGLDRVGKSTLATKLVSHLERLKKSATVCKFPDRTTQVGKLIDDLLRSSSKRIDNHVLHLIFSANRWELQQKIRNTINQGTTVIVDRYSYSGMAYSSAKSDMSLKWCSEMERGLPRPDLVIYLELSREAQCKRPGFGDERFETKEMQDLVRAQFERVMDMSNETWLRIDVERKSPDQVLGEVILPVKRCLESCAAKELGNLDFL